MRMPSIPGAQQAPGGGQAADAPPGPVARFLQGLGRKINDALAVIIPYVAPIPFLLAVFSRAFSTFYQAPSFQRPMGKGPDEIAVGLTASLIMLGCALPGILMVTVKLLVTGSLHSRQRVRLRSPGAPVPPAGARAAPEDEALAFWNRELEQLGERTSRLARHMRIYSFLATTILSVCAVLVLMPRDSLAAGGSVRGVALSTGAAALVTFVLDTGRMVVRAARRDASVRMFASATQRFLLIVTATVLFSFLALLGDIEWTRGDRTMTWLFLGAAMAFLGDRAALAVGDKVADFLKLPGVAAGRDGSLGRIEGVTAEDAARLSEEGISDVHALAFSSTPKLFLSTPYTLTALCDWQDQALLHVRLGPARAAICREQLLVRGATELMQLARDFVGGKLSKEKRDDLVKLLGLPSEVQLHTVMHQAAADPVAARLAALRTAVPLTLDDEEMESAS